MDVREARRRVTAAMLATLATPAALLAGCAPGPIDVGGLAADSLQTDMVAHWAFDDGDGSVASDQSRNGHDGTIVGGTWIDGHFGKALHLASGDSISVPSFPQADRGWTVGVWVRPATGDFGSSYLTLVSTELVFSGGWQVNATLTPGGSLYQFGYWVGPEDPDNTFYNCSCVVTLEWTHLAAVVDIDAGILSFYRDGVLQGRSSATQPIRPGSSTLYMGRWEHDNTRLFTGDLDDVVIYKRPLVAAEVAMLAAAAAPTPN